MKFNPTALKSLCSNKAGRVGLTLQKFSPEILTVAGVVGVVGTAVLVGRATLKSVPVIENLREEKQLLSDALVNGKFETTEYNKHLTGVYVKNSLQIAKLYTPALTLGLASIACLLGAHGIMKKRNAAMAAAYKAVEETLNKYRDRVRTELGEDQERDLYHNLVEKEVINPETDKKEIVKTPADPNTYSGYARIFDETNPNWEKVNEYNLLFLRAQQNYANDLLKARGHLFLNEVYNALGLPHTEAGAVVGWILDKDTSDNFVDFGIFDPSNERAREFVNGYETGIVLDFNVDGLIFNKI